MGAKAEHEAIAKTPGNVLDTEYADFLYSRRHLAMVRQGKWVGAKVGLFATGTGKSREYGYADFDWFRVE